MKSSINQYNQSLNKIYFNPYSHNIFKNTHQNNQFTQTQSTQFLSDVKIRKQNYHRNIIQNGFGSQIQNNHNCNEEKKYRLSAYQLFVRELEHSNKDNIPHPQPKPTVNYFVTEFQRLQLQNRILLAKLNQYDQTKTSKLQNDSALISENKQLHKQLQQQKQRNQQKNQQISQLMNKISEIQYQVQIITKSTRIKDDHYRIKQQEQNKQKLQRENVIKQKDMQIRRMNEQYQMIKQQMRRQCQEQMQKHYLLNQQDNKKAYIEIENIRSYYAQLIDKKCQNLYAKIGFLQAELQIITSQFSQLQKKVGQIKS